MSARRRRSTVDFRHRRASEIVDQDVEAERDGEAVLGLLASVRRFAYVADADSKTDARFPFVLWRPRDGRNQAYALWIINLGRYICADGISVNSLCDSISVQKLGRHPISVNRF